MKLPSRSYEAALVQYAQLLFQGFNSGPALIGQESLSHEETFHLHKHPKTERTSPTPLRFLECQLLKLAGKKVVVMPYGGDVAIVSDMKEHDRQMWLREYPRAAERDAVVRKQMLYFTRRAD